MRQKKFPYTITQQGNVTVNCGIYYKRSKNIVAVVFDLEEKRATIQSTGADGDVENIQVSQNENDPGEKWTDISFPEYAGWNIFCAKIVKYTLSIVFVKKD